jgi:glycosyltransferase involved in cell wall biosynthesis
MKICVNTQTPPVKFKISYTELLEKYGLLDDPLDLASLDRGIDYEYSPGGVTAMVLPMLEGMVKSGVVTDPRWVCLGVNYPPNLRMGPIEVSHVELDDAGLRAYAGFKEVLWSTIHGTPTKPWTKEEYHGYVSYNWVNARKLLDYILNTDVFFVQDFQLLLTGQMIGISAPAVLRWHIPFIPENLGGMHRFVLKAMEGFDSMVVSTRRDLEGLIRSSYHGRAYQVYPYVDESQWSAPPSSAIEALRERVGLQKDEALLLSVARMDPMKSQDLLIRALARVKDRVKAKLVFIGNGSFSSSKAGGLGRDKGTIWKQHLKDEARSLGVDDRVVFLGFAPAEDVQAAYQLASAVVVSSRVEGFGITVLESWINRRPVIVSSGAGASELVVDGSNGFTFPSGDDATLAERILKTTGPGGDQMGQNGYETARQCYVEEAAKKVKAVLEDTISNY